MEKSIAKYFLGRYYCLFSINISFLTPLVFTITAFEINIFQAPETQYPRVDKVQVCKTFQRLCSPDPPFEWFFPLSHSVKTTSRKNSEPFSSSYIAIWSFISIRYYYETKCPNFICTDLWNCIYQYITALLQKLTLVGYTHLP